MARYIGPKSRIARKFGEAIFGPDKNLDRKNFPPGQHGMNKKRKKPQNMDSNRERSKSKYTYQDT
jgi:small subunit ribosomal protein S4